MTKETVTSLAARLDAALTRIEALEASLDKARMAYGELKARVDAAPAPTAQRVTPKRNLWGEAVRSLREERGLDSSAWLPRGDIERRMADLADA